jgi:hypothetical protein
VRHWVLGAGCALALVHATGIARADAETATSLQFDYQRNSGAEGCPSEDDMRQRIASHVGHDPFARGPSRSSGPSSGVRLAIEGAPKGLVARIELRDASGKIVGTKNLDSPTRDCTELASAAALTISVAIDPLRAAEPPPPSTPAPPPPAKSPGVIIVHERVIERVTSAPIPQPPAPWRFRVGGSLVGTFGWEPATSAGLTAFVGVRRGFFTLDLEGRADLPQSKAAGSGGAVRASFLGASLAPCFALSITRACVVGTLGALQGRGEGLDRQLSQDTFYAALGVRLAAEFSLTRAVRLRAHGDLQAPLTRTTLRLDQRDVWTTPSAVALLGIGAVYELE